MVQLTINHSLQLSLPMTIPLLLMPAVAQNALKTLSGYMRIMTLSSSQTTKALRLKPRSFHPSMKNKAPSEKLEPSDTLFSQEQLEILHLMKL